MARYLNVPPAEQGGWRCVRTRRGIRQMEIPVIALRPFGALVSPRWPSLTDHQRANMSACQVSDLHGLFFVVTSEPNFRIECLATGAVGAAAAWFGVTRQEAVLLTFACVIVLGAEMIDTTLERIVNLASPEWREEARLAKDAAAGMVLVTSAGASLCGLLILGPYVW